MQPSFLLGSCLMQLQEVRAEGSHWEHLHFSGEQPGALPQPPERGRGGSPVLRREDGDGTLLRRAVHEAPESTEPGCAEAPHGDEGPWACEQIMAVIMALAHLGATAKTTGPAPKMSALCSRGPPGFWPQEARPLRGLRRLRPPLGVWVPQPWPAL